MMRLRVVLHAVIAVLAAAGTATCRGQTIEATKVDENAIRVVVPGLFETNVTKRKGFVGKFWDLKHDPEKKLDLGPVLDENGILWTKCSFPNNLEKSSGSWYAAPCDKLELLESGPVRARVRTSGPHCRYGKTSKEARWEELGFEQTFTFYASGHVYIDYCLVTKEPVKLHHFLLILKSNGSWGKNGTGEGKGEVSCAGEFGPGRPTQWAKPPTFSSFALQWSDGPTHFQDFLMAMYRGKYGGSYWNEGYQDKDIRTGLGLMSRWKDPTLPAGRDHIRLLFRFGQDMNGHEAAKPYAEDYRSPDKLEVTKGEVVKDDEGDRDSDGFNEEEGCYVLRAGPGGVSFTLHGSKTPRMCPAFKVTGWKAEAPKGVTLGKDGLAAGKDFNASVADGVLLLQILRPVREDALVEIQGA